MSTYIDNAGTIDIRWLIYFMDSMSDFSKWRVNNAILDDYFYIIPETDFFVLLGLSQQDIYDINVSLQTQINGYINHDKTMQTVFISGSLNEDVPFFVNKYI